MIYKREPENFEQLQPRCEIIGFVGEKAIVMTDGGDIRYVDGLTEENVDIGSVIEESASKPINFLSAQEQEQIMSYVEGVLEDMKVPRLTVVDVVAQSGNEDENLLFGQFLDDFYHASNKVALIKDEPTYDESKKLLLCDMAATVHKLANDYSLPVPEWVFDKKYIFDGIYYAFNTKNPEFQKHLEETTPEEYKQRNLFVGDTSLERC